MAYHEGGNSGEGLIITFNHVNASDYFAKMRKEAKEIADREATKMAESMVYILKHRQHLKGGGGAQYPRWQPDSVGNLEKGASFHDNQPSKRSFDYWKKQLRSNGEWYIYNDARAYDGYNYPHALITGKGWNKKVEAAIGMRGGQTKRLIQKGDKIFSKQLPNGLTPWLILKRKDFEENLRLAIKNGMGGKKR